MNYRKIWKTALELLEKDIPIILMVVTESKGSSPGRPGFKMLVTAFGELYGSIGGGKMEYDLVELSRNKLKNLDYSVKLEDLVHNSSSDSKSSGMICSGSQSIVIVHLSAKDIPIIIKILISIDTSEKSILRISNEGLCLVEYEKRKIDSVFCKVNQVDWSYEEVIGKKNIIYIVGGGHVSLALSRIMATLDFYIIVLDPRSEIETFKSNTYANEKMSIPYKDICNYIPEGENIYITIMTKGHEADELVLESVVQKKCRYIGMLGSPKKVKQTFNILKEKGVREELLKIVKAPIGEPINSETPEEIAISIAAEIIKVSK
jgi:xanthine dehydrogenase accessory factor